MMMVSEDRDARHATQTPSLLPLLYAGDQSDGWSQGMRAVTLALLENLTLPDGPVVEVGCGGGQLLREVQRRYPARLVTGTDLNPLALSYAQSALRVEVGLTQAALPNLPWREKTVALLLALDVFDQQGVDLHAAIAEAYRLLRPDGALVMRVSAHPSLYGAHDIAFHTGRRYTRRELQTALTQAGLVVQRLSYANSALALPVAALRLAQRWGLVAWQEETYQQSSLHDLLARLLRYEAAWLQRGDLPWGLSLCAVARKP